MTPMFKKRKITDIFSNNDELGEFVDEVYEYIGGNQSSYANDFRYIIGGIHGYPFTEWYEGIYGAFNKLLKENAIADKVLADKAEQFVLHFKKWFN